MKHSIYSKSYLFGDLIANLPRKPGEAITAKALAKRMDLSEAYIRRKINNARHFGFPICSTNFGYYFSEDPRDIELTINRLKRRISTQVAAIVGLSETIGKEISE